MNLDLQVERKSKITYDDSPAKLREIPIYRGSDSNLLPFPRNFRNYINTY